MSGREPTVTEPSMAAVSELASKKSNEPLAVLVFDSRAMTPSPSARTATELAMPEPEIV